MGERPLPDACQPLEAMQLDANTLEDGVKRLSDLKRYCPFRFSGVYHLAVIDGKCKAYRSKAALMKAAAKAGLQSIAIATL